MLRIAPRALHIPHFHPPPYLPHTPKESLWHIWPPDPPGTNPGSAPVISLGDGEKLCHKCMHDRPIPVRYCHLVVHFHNKWQMYIFVYLL